jgi:Uma2 family endonuclease
MAYPSGMATSPTAGGARYTWNDFIALDDEDKRELIDGELIEVEVPTFTHEEVVGELVIALGNWKYTHGGSVLPSGYKVRISDRRGLMPDVQFFRKGNTPDKDQDQGLVRGHPDLVVEVISPSSRRYDRVTKLNWYAGHGVPEYWIVDPKEKTLERLVLRDGSYAIATSLAGSKATFRPETFDGLEIPLERLWGPDDRPEGEEEA